MWLQYSESTTVVDDDSPLPFNYSVIFEEWPTNPRWVRLELDVIGTDISGTFDGEPFSLESRIPAYHQQDTAGFVGLFLGHVDPFSADETDVSEAWFADLTIDACGPSSTTSALELAKQCSGVTVTQTSSSSIQPVTLVDTAANPSHAVNCTDPDDIWSVFNFLSCLWLNFK